MDGSSMHSPVRTVDTRQQSKQLQHDAMHLEESGRWRGKSQEVCGV